MFAKPQRVTFIDDMVIDVQEAQKSPIMVTLRNEDGKICCKTEKKSDQEMNQSGGKD